jgi:hypothetical protein
MYYLCSVVQVLMIMLCIVMSMGISFLCFTPFRDFYHARVKEYNEATAYLSCDVCIVMDKRIQTLSVNNCEQSEQIVFGSWPIERAIVDTFRNLHPCSDGGCNSIFASLGFSGLIGYLLISVTAIVVIFVVISTYSHYNTNNTNNTNNTKPKGGNSSSLPQKHMSPGNIYYIMQNPYNTNNFDIDDESNYFHQAFNSRNLNASNNSVKTLEYISKKHD